MTIRQLHFEGIADLIDKKGILSSNEIKESEHWCGYHYNRHYRNARSTLAKIDSLVASDENIGEEVWNLLHFGTHPEALHLSKLMEDELGKKAIMKVLTNPFDFLRMYRDAALKNPKSSRVFSTKTMAVLSSLELSYLIIN